MQPGFAAHAFNAKISADGKQTFTFVMTKSEISPPETENQVRDRLLSLSLGQQQVCLKGYEINQRYETENDLIYEGTCK